jgi:hypothetical protein
MNDNAAQNPPQRRFAMYSKLSFIRRFTEEVQQIARFVAFPFDLDIHITEEEIIEELQTGGYEAA